MLAAGLATLGLDIEPFPGRLILVQQQRLAQAGLGDRTTIARRGRDAQPLVAGYPVQMARPVALALATNTQKPVFSDSNSMNGRATRT